MVSQGISLSFFLATIVPPINISSVIGIQSIPLNLPERNILYNILKNSFHYERESETI